jgi:hypothetical protein
MAIGKTSVRAVNWRFHVCLLFADERKETAILDIHVDTLIYQGLTAALA